MAVFDEYVGPTDRHEPSKPAAKVQIDDDLIQTKLASIISLPDTYDVCVAAGELRRVGLGDLVHEDVPNGRFVSVNVGQIRKHFGS